MRKTELEIDIETRTPEGWEVATCEANWKDARQALREYRENEPQYSHRARAHRVPTQEWIDYAKRVLREAHADNGEDFHTLRSEQVEVIVRHAAIVKYRKPKNANGSTGRYFYALLQRVAKREAA
jgi:hypothetical protein